MILRRTDMPLWGVPGGSVELGESLQDAAQRETLEETGLRLGDANPFGLSSDPGMETFTYPNGDRIQSVSLLLHARWDVTAPRSNDGEASQFQFANPDNIDRTTFLAPEYPVFGHFRRYRESGVFQLV